MKPKHYFEPWKAAQSKAWESQFRSPPPVEDPDVLDRWHTARDRAEKHAEWIVWGAGMVPQAIAGPPAGIVVMDDRHIICRIAPPITDVRDGPDQGALSRRVVACVNACQWMIDPQKAITETRGLLLDLASGRADASDPRLVRCTALMSGPCATNHKGTES